jgi:hypothetical protein
MELSGLVGSQPIGALAAFGLLRIGSRFGNLGLVRLGWRLGGEPIAVLQTEKDCDAERLVSLLVDHMHGRDRFAPFSREPDGIPAGSQEQITPADERDDLKGPPELFARLLVRACDGASAGCRECVDFLAAFASEFITAPSTGELKPTAFHMTAGQQQFLKSVRELATSLDAAANLADRKAQKRREEIRTSFQEALFGPWRYRDKSHSLGWDPGTEALYALSAVAPTDAKPKSVRAAVWLAVESLPLFPCFAVSKRLHTRGFNRTADEFRWPTWRTPISFDALRSLLALPALYESPPSIRELTGYGIERVYQTARPTDDKGRGVFRPATPVFIGS